MNFLIIFQFLLVFHAMNPLSAETNITTEINEETKFTFNLGDKLLVVNPNANSLRIIGGTEEKNPEIYPFIVQIAFRSDAICGGTLITNRHVMTAAHCVANRNGAIFGSTYYYSIRAGSIRKNYGGVVRNVDIIIVHKQYNTPLFNNDISIMVLEYNLTYSKTVQAAPIPYQNFDIGDDKDVTVLGWGRTEPFDYTSSASVLNQVTVRTVNRDNCDKRYRFMIAKSAEQETLSITENMFCSGLLDIGGKDACAGDSGGPVVFRDVVVGITSFGEGCASPFYPGVNVKVSKFTDWINDTISRNYKLSKSAVNVRHENCYVYLVCFILFTALLI